jgi:hypothetical protein
VRVLAAADGIDAETRVRIRGIDAESRVRIVRVTAHATAVWIRHSGWWRGWRKLLLVEALLDHLPGAVLPLLRIRGQPLTGLLVSTTRREDQDADEKMPHGSVQ